MKTVSFEEGITVEFDPFTKSGTVDCEKLMGAFNNDVPWDCGMHGITSLILACACAGVDIGSFWFRNAVSSAIEAVNNELGD